jgi:hypothetical protein
MKSIVDSLLPVDLLHTRKSAREHVPMDALRSMEEADLNSSTTYGYVGEQGA